MKKQLLTLAAILFIATTAWTQTPIPNSNLTWKLQDSTLTIAGTGAMPDFTDDDVPWHDSRNAIKTTIIKNGVTSIGNYAFSLCFGLTSITLPESVTSIGNYTFYACNSLTSVTIPELVTTIGRSAFSGCKNLTEITIPDSVTSIENYTFYACNSLTSVIIGNSVTSDRKSVV